MLKRVILAAVATAFVAAFVAPVASTSADAAGMSCRQAAKAKFANDRKSRHAYKKECKAAWKAQQKA